MWVQLKGLEEVTQDPEPRSADRLLEAIRQEEFGQVALEPPRTIGRHPVEQLGRRHPPLDQLEGRIAQRLIPRKILGPDPGRLDEQRGILQPHLRAAKETAEPSACLTAVRQGVGRSDRVPIARHGRVGQVDLPVARVARAADFGADREARRIAVPRVPHGRAERRVARGYSRGMSCTLVTGSRGIIRIAWQTHEARPARHVRHGCNPGAVFAFCLSHSRAPSESSRLLRGCCQDLSHLGEIGGLDQVVIEARFLGTLPVCRLFIPRYGN